MTIADVVSGLLLGLGAFFLVTGGVGALRMPDFHSRMHPAAKGDTAGQVLILLGLIVEIGFTHASLKLVLVSLFLLITAPTATHAMARAAYVESEES